jgi:hypothetical protein
MFRYKEASGKGSRFDMAFCPEKGFLNKSRINKRFRI